MNMLRSIREKKGLTLGQLAARASIPSRVLVEYEEGRQPIPLPHAKLLAKALWVRIEELMPPGTGGPAPSPAPAQPSTSTNTPTPAPPAPRPEYRPQPDQQGAPPAANTQRPVYQPPTVPAQPPRPPHASQSQGQAAPQPSGSGARPSRPGEGGPQGQHPRKGPDGRGARPPRPAPPPPKPVGEGQVEELVRLGARLEMDQAQLEERTGKPLTELTRIEAKDWIKRFRDTLEEASPSGRISFGQWPGAHEDREATYLGQQRDADAALEFKLFNGEMLKGRLVDFTPYTITVKSDSGEETVLRKLAIVYYRQTSSAEVPTKVKAAPKAKRATKAKEQPQPVDPNVDSDRIGEPDTPETDNMDEDRGL